MKTFVLALATTALTASIASAASIGQFDTNGDRFASFEEVVAVNPTVSRNDFRNIDVNRDRRLSAVEIEAPEANATLERGTRATGVVLSTTDISGGAFVSQAQLMASYPGLSASEFRAIDQNKDNRVSATELYAANAQSTLGSYKDSGPSILVSLDSIDLDGSGFASLGELQNAYPGLSANDLRFFDVNRDGRISYNEFYSADAIQVLGKNK